MMSTGKILSFKERSVTDKGREARQQALSARRRVENERADSALRNRPATGKKTRISRNDADQMAGNLRNILNRVGKSNWAEICAAAGINSRGQSTKNLGRYLEKGACSTVHANYRSLAEQAALCYPPAEGDKIFFLADLIRGTSFEPAESSINFNINSDGWAMELCRALSKLEGVLPSDTQELLEKCHAAKFVAARPLSEKPEFSVSEDLVQHSMYFLYDEWLHNINLPGTVNTIPLCSLGKTAAFESQCRITSYKNILTQEETLPDSTALMSLTLEFYYAYPADDPPFIAIKPCGEVRIGNSCKTVRSIFRVNPAEENLYKALFCVVTDTGTDQEPISPEVFHCSMDQQNGFPPLLSLFETAPFLYKNHEGNAISDESCGVVHADLIHGKQPIYFIGESYYCELLNYGNCLKYFRLAAVGAYHDFAYPSDHLASELLPPAGSIAANIIDNLRQPENAARLDQQLIAQYNHIQSELDRLNQSFYKSYEDDMKWLLDK